MAAKESQSVADKNSGSGNVVTSLAEIQKLSTARKKVEFKLGEQTCSLEMRTLTPAEEARISDIVDAVTPPLVKGNMPEQDRIDTTNSDYIKRKTAAAIQARSQALYWAYEAFQQAKPGLTDLGQVTEFVQGQLTEPILNVLWTDTRKGGIDFVELVNFT
jgi:hypothetical protein